MEEFKLTVSDDGSVTVVPLGGQRFSSEIVVSEWGIICYVNSEGKAICGCGKDSTCFSVYEIPFCVGRGYRKATPEECAILDNALKESLLCIKDDKLVRYRVEDRQYYAINSMGEIEATTDIDHRVDRSRFECGNYFGSIETARKCLTKIKEVFDEFKYIPGN